jgi:hypothetical protein
VSDTNVTIKNMKITLEINDEVITLELHDDSTISDMIQKFKILLSFCGYAQESINEYLKEEE